jgi:hypothetical protein
VIHFLRDSGVATGGCDVVARAIDPDVAAYFRCVVEQLTRSWFAGKAAGGHPGGRKSIARLIGRLAPASDRGV